MAAISYNDGGTWRTPSTIAYKDGVTWRTLTAVHYNDGGTWRQVFGSGGGGSSLNLATSYGIGSTAGNAANLLFNTDGSITYLEDGATTNIPTQWLSSQPDAVNASLYSVRRTQVSGALGVSFTGTMTSGTWYPLTSQRGVSATSTGGATRSNVSTYDFALTADTTTVLASTTVTVTSDP